MVLLVEGLPADEKQREHDVADTARYPDGDKEHREDQGQRRQPVCIGAAVSG
jgi:hypothetical protein